MWAIFILIVIIIIIILTTTRTSKIYKSNIRKHSKKYLEISKLNSRYNFRNISSEHTILYVCKSLQQIRDRNNGHSIIEYLVKTMRREVEHWELLNKQATENKIEYTRYLKELHSIISNFSDTSYQECKANTRLGIGNYKKYEADICRKIWKDEPTTGVKILCHLSYKSLAGKKSYSAIWDFDLKLILHAMKQRVEKEKTVQYQRSIMTKSKRYDIFKRDNFSCVICGRGNSDGVKLEVDHTIPVSKGGRSIDKNLQTLCYDCNRGKSAKL